MNLTKNILILIIFVSFFSGCGAIRNLRKDISEEDVADDARYSDFDYLKPENRYVPPPPANVGDSRGVILSGSPVDLSGTRAKQLRVTAKDFVAENMKNENSLWLEDGQTNYLFARNKLKQPGDLVSVVIEDGLRGEMIGSVKKILPPEYRDQEIRVPGLTKEKAEGDSRAPASTPNTTASTDSTENYNSNDLLTAEVLERYPNGNVRVRGIKRVPFKNQVRNIEVVAIVKGSDISEQDIVKSSKFFEQRVELYR